MEIHSLNVLRSEKALHDGRVPFPGKQTGKAVRRQPILIIQGNGHTGGS